MPQVYRGEGQQSTNTFFLIFLFLNHYYKNFITMSPGHTEVVLQGTWNLINRLNITLFQLVSSMADLQAQAPPPPENEHRSVI